jgi:hypothetical protein
VDFYELFRQMAKAVRTWARMAWPLVDIAAGPGEAERERERSEVTISSRRAAGLTGKRQTGQLDIRLIRERDDWFAWVAPKTFPRDHAGVASPLHKASVVSAAHCRLPAPPVACRLPVVRVGRAPKISTPENDGLGTGARCVPEPRGAVQAVRSMSIPPRRRRSWRLQRLGHGSGQWKKKVRQPRRRNHSQGAVI